MVSRVAAPVRRMIAAEGRVFRPESGDVLLDVHRFQEVEITKDGRRMTLRTSSPAHSADLQGRRHRLLPSNIRDPAPT